VSFLKTRLEAGEELLPGKGERVTVREKPESRSQNPEEGLSEPSRTLIHLSFI
jgi:hypothetical protein